MSRTAQWERRTRELEDLTRVFVESPALVRAVTEESLAEWRRFARALSDIVAAQVASPIDPSVTIASDQVAGVPIRTYTPRGWDIDAGPLLVFLHGGGFVFGEPHELINDSLLSNRARATGLRILSLGYSLSPEARFPVAREETARVCAALRSWCPTAWMGLGGTSAGAAIALSAVTEMIAAGERLPDGLLLEVPPAGPGSAPTEEDHLAVRDQHANYAAALAAYRGAAEDALLASDHPDPLLFPPTLIMMAQHDVLREGGELLAERLAAAGTAVTAEVVPGTIHASIGSTLICEAAREWEATVAGWLAAQRSTHGPATVQPTQGEHHVA